MKRLLQLLNLTDEEEIEQKESEYKPQQKHIEAKVTYDYPKGNFRFPLIPDTHSKKTNASNRPKVSNPSRKKENRTDTNSNKSIKQPFRPTDIPSAVYGYGKPKSKEVIEFELDPPTSIENKQEHMPIVSQEEVAASINLVDNQQIKQEYFQQPLEQVERIEEDESLEPLEQDHSINITDILKELKEEPEIEQQQEELQNEVDEDLDIEEPELEPDPEPEVQARKTPHVPFNVMMLKQDRDKLKKSESIKREPVPLTIEKEETEILNYHFPKLDVLHSPPIEQIGDNQWLEQQRNILDETLRNFKVRAKVVNVTQGPAVTRFEVHPEPGVKVNKITNLSDDIKLSLAAKDIRIEAPIPGKNTIGIEVPNKTSKPVLLKEIIQSNEFAMNKSPLTVALGLDISGKPIVTDLQKMPHGLIAGATGSGKSVCINAMLVSLLYKSAPHQVKLLLIDPKMVELAPYNHIPHLVSPVITDVKAATAALKWAVEEMERRYELFAHSGVRDIGRYNEMVKKYDEKSGELPYLVIIIDELADLMMVAPGDVEEAICRIAQKARACGIHLILATQRPSVDVITGLIKANIPTRIAFSVSSQVDSRTIIDTNGADKLLGKGDMLFLENGSSKPIRVQGNFVSDDEIEQVVEFVKSEMKPSYMFEQEELIKKASISNDEDELFHEACEFVLDHGGASTSSIQRRFRIGYNRAARLIDMMEDQGIISESRGSKPREVLITEEDLANIQED
ncbi:DNA translocase FtsK [Fredinandcohnia sp. SECRCQ15]|uniref:DNA translocase FtsK n=2 Tax=Fredinandcohnia quinoae TaxID=2918902 RepID=A0AAW5DZ42_9BACI|nr:DNA translocase FtsK [Fredinandcohnia sp. SECRCQ15]MCH1625348.1 DNA translocase FtsK [Fredinandcohnia sp. SECRCQ15]